ncbi:MAG: hypothetical protein LBV33_02885 [Lachnospiraceae bacterium]|jgi:hypothetical protein|nr:hypothetical protein [Lachnospiraceae bacterium]
MRDKGHMNDTNDTTKFKPAPGKKYICIQTIIVVSGIILLLISSTGKYIRSQSENTTKALFGEVLTHEVLSKEALSQKQLLHKEVKRLTDITTHLAAMDGVIADNKAQLAGVLSATDETSDRSDEQFSAIRDQVEVSVSDLIKRMEDLQTQIEDTGQSVVVLLEGMVVQDENRQLELQGKFASVESGLDQIGSDISKAKTEIKSLIAKINTELSTELKEALNEVIMAITELESGLLSDSAQNLANISENMQSIGDQINVEVDTAGSEIISAVGVSISGLATQLTTDLTGLNGQIGQLESAILANLNTISTAIDENDQAQQLKYDNLLNEIKAEIQPVFQRVSDGKKLLASTLLTKGITINKDATFAQFATAILNIPQSLVIGVEEIPGTVSYDHHYHLDGSGGEPHLDNNSTAGGCYTVPVYHAHTSACYRTVYYHVHSGSCPGHSMWVDWVSAPYWGWSYDCNNSPNNASRQESNCTKSGSTIDAYRIDCGFTDGQIIGAHIVYAQGSSLLRGEALPSGAKTVADDAEILAGADHLKELDVLNDLAKPDDLNDLAESEDLDRSESPGEPENSDQPDQPGGGQRGDGTESPGGLEGKEASGDENPVAVVSGNELALSP